MANPVDGEDWFQDSVLGHGGFGTVSLWKNNSTSKCLAVKVSKWGPDTHQKTIERWQQEIQIMKKLDHPCVVRAMDPPSGMPGFDFPPLVLEYCDRGDLRKVLRQAENVCGLQEAKVREVLKDIGSAIEYLHNNQIIHRDVKPENILLKEEDLRVVHKLADMGYAKDLDRETTCQSYVGTEQYLAPELFERVPYDHTVDYWSFGTIIYECITGSRPFASDDVDNSWIRMAMIKKDEDICVNADNGGFSKKIPNSAPHHLSELSRICFENWLRMMLIRDARRRGGDRDQETKRPKCFEVMDNVLSLRSVSVFCVNTNTTYVESLSGAESRGAGSEDSGSSPSPSVPAPQADLISHYANIPVEHQLYLLEDGQEIDPMTLHQYSDKTLYLFDRKQLPTMRWTKIDRPHLVNQFLGQNVKPGPPMFQKRRGKHIVYYCHKLCQHFQHMKTACLASLRRLWYFRQACGDTAERVRESAIRLHEQADFLLSRAQSDIQHFCSFDSCPALDVFQSFACIACEELGRLKQEAEVYQNMTKHSDEERKVDEYRTWYNLISRNTESIFNNRKSEAVALYDKLQHALRENKPLPFGEQVRLLRNCEQNEKVQGNVMMEFLRNLHKESLPFSATLKSRQETLEAARCRVEEMRVQVTEIMRDYQRHFWEYVQDHVNSASGNSGQQAETPDTSSTGPKNYQQGLNDIFGGNRIDSIHELLDENITLRQRLASMTAPNTQRMAP